MRVKRDIERIVKNGYNIIKTSMKIIIAILCLAICLLCWETDLSAQEKDNKRWEVSCYFGRGGHGTEGAPIIYAAPSYGLGVEYFLTPRISLEGEINYLSGIAYVSGGPSISRYERTVKIDDLYRLIWDINLLFHFDLTKIKRPKIRLFLTVGTGYQYDWMESIVVSLQTLEFSKCGYGEFRFIYINYGAGLKVNILDDWALKFLYKIHCAGCEEIQTSRFAFGLSYRF
ncbi:MAG: porin family protein [Candidatus Aminicenantes bacterium]|nr:porin family protein [Candidatus Aminicenantes bacterium]MDH5715378.1 porin family protein [Candidatus Aminicenantes bacterium]